MIRMRKERVFQSPFHRQGNRSPGRVRLPKHSKESQPAPHRPSTLTHMAAWLRHRAHRISHAFCTWQDWMRWTTEQEGEGGHSFRVKVSVYFVERTGEGGEGSLEFLLGNGSTWACRPFCPFSKAVPVSSQLQGSRPASCYRITQQPQLERLLEHL